MSAAGHSYLLSDYLERLPGTTFRKLYQQPSSSMVIFRRMLPPLAKRIVMMLLYMPGPVTLEDLDVWVNRDCKSQRDRSLASLRALHMAQITPPSKDKAQEMTLTANFKKSMRQVLEGGGDHQSFDVPSLLDVSPEITLAFLDGYVARKWDDMLHYIVNSAGYQRTSGNSASGPKSSVKQLLLAGRLVEPRGSSHATITTAGFSFLLQEKSAQVWTLLLLWLEAAEHNGLDSVDMLSFLFMLATLEPGAAYDTAALPEARRDALASLVDFGLIYVPRDTPQQFFPTRLATELMSSPASSSSSTATQALAPGAGDPAAAPSEDKSNVIVETNYRLYAYTSSPLQIAVLGLFARLHLRFANLVTGRLTRESVRRAIAHGITSDQIISYLEANAHDSMVRVAAAKNSQTVMPPTVIDQIRLWQLENERMTPTRGFLFKDFESRDEYQALVTYADEVGVLKWRSDAKQMFFASRHEQLRDYLKSRKKA